MSENPWRNLPQSPPYVLPDDEPFIRDFNIGLDSSHVHFVQIGKIVPEAFVGVRDAPVLLLSNNPGFGGSVPDRQKADFAAKMRKNLLHKPLDNPFLFLSPDFSGPGKKWWQSKLKELIELFGDRVIVRSVLNIVYFPYPSRKYRHQRRLLPSQDYSFRLVGEAVNRNAVVVLMRPGKEKAWLRAVPELTGYDRLFRVKNPRMPAISRRNCKDFEQIVRAIEAAEVKSQST